MRTFFRKIIAALLILPLVFGTWGIFPEEAQARTTDAFSTPGAALWTAPAGVTRVDAACWGAGGGGGFNTSQGGGGGGGGAFASSTRIVQPGKQYKLFIATGPASDSTAESDSSFSTSTVADGGVGTGGAGAGTAGQSADSSGDVKFSGGAGGGGTGTNDTGGGGGGAAGSQGVGGGGATAPGTTGGGGGGGNGGNTSTDINGGNSTNGGSGGNGGNGGNGSVGTDNTRGGGGGGGSDTSANGANGGDPGGGGGGGDNAGGQGGDGRCEVTYAVSGLSAVSLKVSTANDDAEELAGVMNLWGGEVIDALNEYSGWRWQNVQIPQGSRITKAILRVILLNGTNDQPQHELWGEDIDNAPQFTTAANNISSRTKTSASVRWTSADLGASAANVTWWTWGGTSADVASIVQEIVDRPGWQEGNAMVMFMSQYAPEDTARQLQLREYEDSPGTYGMELEIEFESAQKSRKMQLFDGFRIKFIEGRLKLIQ